MRLKKSKAEKVWAYLLKHPEATTKEVAKACKCSAKYVYNLRSKTGTPKEVLTKSKVRMRTQILTSANELVSDKREQEHGDFLSNAYMIANYWNTHLGLIDFIKPTDVPTMLALLKIARSHQKPQKADNYRDACGYLALASEVASASE
tara:strand:+ start:2629 stop:3072 length:444 start_codon:yes stop_codon:yes gene_type:complete